MLFFGKSKKKGAKSNNAAHSNADMAVFGQKPATRDLEPPASSPTAKLDNTVPTATAKRTPAPPADQAPSPGPTHGSVHTPSVEDEFCILDMSALEGVQSGHATGAMVMQRYAVGRYEGGRSKQGLPVKAGEVFVLETDVRLERPGTTSNGSYLLAGCLYIDAEGRVIQWWDAHDVPLREGRTLVVKSTAPAGAVVVKAGLHGTWNAEGSADDCVVSYGPATLRKVRS